jgi:transmembrane sensor
VKPAKSERELEAIASDWIARRDRGLPPGEAAELAAWLAEDRRHARAFATCEKTWGRLPNLRELPAGRIDDLFTASSRSRRRAWPIWAAGLAAAATLAFFLHRSGPTEPAPEVAGIRYAAGSAAEERFTLPDGTIADLRRGAEFRLQPATDPAAGIGVTLVRGEAHFTVARKSAGRFVVQAGGASVRDLGTAFDVQLESGRLTVLVTEGKVAVGSAHGTEAPRTVAVGEAAFLSESGDARAIEIRPADAAEFDRQLAWRNRRLTFARTPLAEVVTEMNRYHHRQLEIADAETAAVLVTGSFRSDNLDALVHLLAEGFDVTAESRKTDGILLRKTN